VAVSKKAQLSVVVSNDKHRTNPKAASLHRIPNYPTKLVIYQLAASPYWWVRYYQNKRILRKSTKETDKRKADCRQHLLISVIKQRY
jgi:mitochondrial fission protein ELM1